jgi:NADH-quinone oxidoreductase subunit N
VHPLLAQLTPASVDFPWSALSPDLVIFGAGILALLLDTAGETRLRSSFIAMGATIAGAAAVILRTQGGDAPQLVLPLLVALGGVLQFAMTLIWRDRPRTLGAIIVAFGFAAGLGVTAWQWHVFAGQGLVAVDGLGERTPLVGTASILEGMVAVDGVALFTRVTVFLAGLLTIPLGFSYAEERRLHRGEYYPLLAFAATGMTLLAAANDLIMVFIAIEVLSLALYVLAGFAKRDLRSQESAVKYFLLGAFSSAMLLYGIALAYGVTGSTNIPEVGRAFASVDAPLPLTLASIGLMLVGFGFKTSLVPFHMWTPDVYQGAPTPVTGFMAAATKAAAFAAFLRVFTFALGDLSWSWGPAVAVVAVVTMLAGAILAVVQTDVKRMLGYSAIAHAGYVLIGLVAIDPLEVGTRGVAGVLLYLLVYALMSIGAFGVLALFERRLRKSMTIADLAGIGRRYPVPSAMFAVMLLSLAGIPGTAGFWAKFAVFAPGIDAGYWPLVVVAVVSSVIAAFFYLRVIVAMFMDEESEAVLTRAPLGATSGPAVGLAVATAAVIGLGILPGTLVDLARQAASFAG